MWLLHAQQYRTQTANGRRTKHFDYFNCQHNQLLLGKSLIKEIINQWYYTSLKVVVSVTNDRK